MRGTTTPPRHETTPARLTAAAIAFGAPVLVVASGQSLVGSPGLFVGVLDALLGAWMLQSIWMRAQAKREARRLFGLVGLLGAWVAVSAVFGIVRSGGTPDVRALLLLGSLLLPYAWFGLSGSRFAARPYFGKLLLWLARGCLVAAALELLLVSTIVLRDGATAWITLANEGSSSQNVVGMVMVLGTAVILPGGLFQSRAKTVGALALLALATAWIFSRSSYLALCAVYVVHFVQTPRRIASLALLAASGFVVARFAPKALEAPLARVTYTTERGELDPSSRVRIELWGASITTFLAHPLTGIGFGRPVAEANIDPTLDPARLVYSHNYYLTLAAQTGIAGLLLVFSMFGVVLHLSWCRRLEVNARRALLATIGVMVASCFGEPLLVSGFFVAYLIVAAGIGAKAEWSRP